MYGFVGLKIRPACMEMCHWTMVWKYRLVGLDHGLKARKHRTGQWFGDRCVLGVRYVSEVWGNIVVIWDLRSRKFVIIFVRTGQLC